MSELEIKHIHEDLETIKNDLAVLKHILSEEGKLSDEIKVRVEKARKTPLNEYVEL